jgi:hypothetical protein
MWGTGYGSRFTPLFDEDSVHFGKIAMQKETVLINIYPGFAAIKGEYWMQNTTSTPITMTVGYPVKGVFEEDKIGNIHFEDLSNLKVLVNGQPVQTSRTGDTTRNLLNQEWHYWKTTFAANSITRLTVYFLTDNSNTVLREGYNTSNGNAFSYILESGRAWGGNIGNGQILIQLMDGLELDDIKGVLPDSTLMGDNTHLQFTFSNLEPYPANNILIWYDRGSIDFKSVSSKAENYFAVLDKFPIADFNQPAFKIVSKNDFEPASTNSIIFWAAIIGGLLLILGVLVTIIYFLFKVIRKAVS